MQGNRFSAIARDLAAHARAAAHAAREAAAQARLLIEKLRASGERAGAAIAHAAGELAACTRRLPPERTGAIGGAVVALIMLLVAALIGLHRERLAAEARAIAAREHASQQAAVPAPAPPAPAPAREAAVAPSPASLPQVGEAFLDRFDGPELDERWFVSDGWSNGSWMENDWRRSQVSLTPEGLRITLGPGPEGSEKPFASGEIRTIDEFRYGYVEVRMRLPRGPGLVTGAFTHTGRKGRLHPNEIDIEVLGRSTDKMETTLHVDSRASSKKVSLAFDAAADFHSYGFDWQPGYVRWYVDGEMVHEDASAAAQKLNRPQQIILMLWASRQLSSWVGELDASAAPWVLDFACVGYQPSYPGKPICD